MTKEEYLTFFLAQKMQDEQNRRASEQLDLPYQGTSTNIQQQPRDSFSNEMLRYSDPNHQLYNRRYNPGGSIVSDAISRTTAPLQVYPRDKALAQGKVAPSGFAPSKIDTKFLEGLENTQGELKKNLMNNYSRLEQLGAVLQGKDPLDMTLRPAFEEYKNLYAEVMNAASQLKTGQQNFEKVASQVAEGETFFANRKDQGAATSTADVGAMVNPNQENQIIKSIKVDVYNRKKDYNTANAELENLATMFDNESARLGDVLASGQYNLSDKERIENQARLNKLWATQARELRNDLNFEAEKLGLEKRKVDITTGEVDFAKQTRGEFSLWNKDVFGKDKPYGEGLGREFYSQDGLKSEGRIQDVSLNENGTYKVTVVTREWDGSKQTKDDSKYSRNMSYNELVLATTPARERGALTKWIRENNLGTPENPNEISLKNVIAFNIKTQGANKGDLIERYPTLSSSTEIEKFNMKGFNMFVNSIDKSIEDMVQKGSGEDAMVAKASSVLENVPDDLFKGKTVDIGGGIKVVPNKKVFGTSYFTFIKEGAEILDKNEKGKPIIVENPNTFDSAKNKSSVVEELQKKLPAVFNAAGATRKDKYTVSDEKEEVKRIVAGLNKKYANYNIPEYIDNLEELMDYYNSLMTEYEDLGRVNYTNPVEVKRK